MAVGRLRVRPRAVEANGPGVARGCAGVASSWCGGRVPCAFDRPAGDQAIPSERSRRVSAACSRLWTVCSWRQDYEIPYDMT